MVDVGGKPARTLPKDVTFDVVSDRPVHVDFLRISEHAKVHVNVPVHFADEEKAPGIKRGGVLNVVRHELELVVDAANIPEEIHISLAGLEVGDSIHISQVKLPKGTKSAIEDRDFTIATVIAPSALKSEAIEQAAEEAAEAEAQHEEHVAEVEAAEAEAEAADEGSEEAGEA
jgi:large subunit ribosomal protein L25